MSVKSRDYLKTKFQHGDIPDEQEFVDLIDSCFNKNDDDVSSILSYTPENIVNKNQSNGYAGLDGTGRLYHSLLPTNIVPVDVGLGNITNDLQVKASQIDIDPTFAANSDTKVPSQKAVKSLVDTKEDSLGFVPVPNTRTVNSKQLNLDITLTNSDIGLSEVTNDAQVKRSEMGLANGVASLDANGKLLSGQLPENLPFTIPIATVDDLGGIKIGDNLFIDGQGTLSATLVSPDWNATEEDGYSFILNKPDIEILTSITAGSIYYRAIQEASTTSDAYTKLLSTKMCVGGTVNVQFIMKTDTNTAYGRIYVNDVAVGTEQTTTSTTYEAKTESITVEEGDLVQLYGKNSNTGSLCAVKGFNMGIDVNTNYLIHTGTINTVVDVFTE